MGQVWSSTDIYRGIESIILMVGDDPNREGLAETGARVKKAFEELCSGYKTDIPSLFKTFKEGACDEMVLVADVEFVALCEHHLLPFQGVAHVGYLPAGKVIGLSKIARLVDAYSKRLQVQERLTQEITKAMDEYLKPLGSACVIEAHHLCMSCRGVRKRDARMVTSSLTGAFKDEPETRAEFLQLVQMTKRSPR